VTPAPPSDLSAYQRSHLVSTGVRAALTAAVLLAAYFLIPAPHRHHESPALRLVVALAIFVVVVANEVRLISAHERPLLRAGVAMATVIPLFLVLFSWIYLTMSQADPTAFTGSPNPLDRPSALYFTVTVFSTVGFGDITPHTDPARMVVMVQMLADLAVIAVVIRLIFGAVNRAVRERDPSTGEGGPGPVDPQVTST
jgi:voltage-gated potassium channel